MTETSLPPVRKRVATVKQIPQLYPGVYSEGALRWMIFNSHENGLADCIIREGRRVLIDLDRWEARLETLRCKAAG